MRRWLGLVLVLAACSGPDPLVDPGPTPPNLILIGLDTFRADHIGVYGSGTARTPALDRFAAEAIVFEDCASTSTWTLPSFASVFTGRLPSEHRAIGGEHSALPPDEVTLAERLRAAGYHTTAIVAVDYLDDPFGLRRGFDRFEKHTDVPVNGRLRYYDRRIQEVLRVPPQQPWFLFVHYFDAHDPYLPPDEFGAMYYEGDPTQEPADPSRDIDVIYSAANRLRRDPRAQYRWLEGVRDLQFPVAEYAGGISYVDHHVGVVLDSLRSRGILDESIVVVLGDHGEHLTEHDIYFTHRLPYSECLQVPLMIRLPGGRRGGTRVTAPVSLADVLPTLLELLGLERAPRVTGQSLVGLVRGEPAKARLLFAEYGGRQDVWAKSVWDARWRYTEIQDPDRFTVELFDRQADPREEHDLAALRPDVAARYAAALDARFGPERRLLQDRSGESPAVDIDPATLERLRALGYVDVGGR